MQFFKTDILLLYFLNEWNIKYEKTNFLIFFTWSTFIIMGTFMIANYMDIKNREIYLFFFKNWHSS